ncbi:Unknown protein [Striga hermonthica]|uniref:INO80 complex subunit B-like conserved region domain-containing protein n=1 Tax=Striga hermonthica TaxID=68872 RepID=A0A9N7REX3_STRHE|nr:Unknown protein [Striga hermonthica]
MDQPQVPQLEAGVSIKRKRSQTSRRPRPEAQPFPEQSPVPSTPVSDDLSKVSSDENDGDGNSGGKMFNLSQCVSRSLPAIGPDSGSNAILGNGVICGGSESQNKLKKVKLKVGGVTCTIGAKFSANGTSGSVSSSPTSDKKRGLQGIPWKDFSKGNFNIGNAIEKPGDKFDSVRKSKRVPKRRVLHADFDDDDDADDEIRYLEKLKSSKMHKGGKYDNWEDVGRLGRKPRTGDIDYEEEEDEPSSDGEGMRRKKLKKDLSELDMENKREIALTTRQRALLTKDASASGQIEFPNGLPPAAPRKQKEKLSEVEQQLKKAEAAQRRRMQNEKAARESEAEAIRKILGQDSSRKKREEKMKKRQEELAQEKAAHALMLASNTIRTVMGPTGTTVTFPQELGLPKIFESISCSYPPPREKCVGPFCTNDYKYRDSRLKLPLCSLQCYKAINEKINAGRAC